MKIVRTYTFEGPEDWLRHTMKNSLPDGEQGFLKNSCKKITVETTLCEVPDPAPETGEGNIIRMDLGYANGWEKTPPIVEACKALGHVQGSRNEGNCLTRYGCDLCGFTYLVDSSD